MTPFKSVIRKSVDQYRLSDVECDAIKAKFKIDDEPSKVLTSGGGCFWGQFWAHGTMDSMDGQSNRYTGVFDGMDGVYPKRGASNGLVMDRDGYFKLPDDDLPIVNVGENVQITPDPHRANENPVLKAHHLAFARLHNKRLKAHGDYERAKTETLSGFVRIFINETLHMCQATEREMFDIQVKGFNVDPAFNFAVARLQHLTTPGTTNGKHVFRSEAAADVDLIALYDGTEMARTLNMGVCQPMTNMGHVGGEIDIRERTIGRHSEHGLPCYGDLAKAMRVTPSADIDPSWPIWPAIALEAELQGDGFVGPVGRRAFMDGIAGSIIPAHRESNPWKEAPADTLGILEYATS